MRRISYNLIIAIGMILAFSLVSASANPINEKTKKPKNMGVLSVKTDTPMDVLVDGVRVGTSGVGTAADFYVTPGNHTVEIQGPGGQKFVKEYLFTKNVKNCICLKTLEKVESKECPYNIRVDAPDAVRAGDLVTFAAFNAVTGGGAALNYLWKVSPDNARITSGLGTSSITVDTSDLGNQVIRAELEVTDGIYDAECRQRVAAESRVEKIIEKQPDPVRCDAWETRTFDEDKARLDNCVIELQNRPDYQMYLIVYQGTAKRSTKAETLINRTLTYLVKSRGVPPQRVQIISGGSRPKTGYELYLIPPGVSPPTPTPAMY